MSQSEPTEPLEDYACHNCALWEEPEDAQYTQIYEPGGRMDSGFQQRRLFSLPVAGVCILTQIENAPTGILSTHPAVLITAFDHFCAGYQPRPIHNHPSVVGDANKAQDN